MTRRGARNKERGYELEAELVKAAEEAGLPAQRAWGSNGKALGLQNDVDLVVKVQAKRHKRLPAWAQIPESCDLVAFRQDRDEPLVMMRYADFLKWMSWTGAVAVEVDD